MMNVEAVIRFRSNKHKTFQLAMQFPIPDQQRSIYQIVKEAMQFEKVEP
jgi:hypothetical protein